MAKSPSVGIDFGTTYSKMAWYNPIRHQAEPLRNNEQREQTPSVVYLGWNQTRVGDPAVDMLEDEQERENVVISAKRQLVNTPLLALSRGSIHTVDVVATILRKLKEDAEKSPLLQGQEVTRAVLTYPASFDHLYRDKLREAGRSAGFNEIELLDEPTAAALAYAHMGSGVGNHVLVYDLGGGTFDLALLVREDNDTFRLAMDPQGMERCGGDDFDEALYNKCDEIAREKLGRPISPTGERELNFLNECRHWKERLSRRERCSIKYLLEPEAVPFQYDVDRATFEDLIRATIEETIRRAEEILRQAEADGNKVDTLVLVGGSTNIPLVQRLLKERLNLQPLVWHYMDTAVALGAAYYAYNLWGSENQYRRALTAAWVGQRLDESKIAELTKLANALELGEGQIAELERLVMGDTKAKILARQVAEDEYRAALEEAWDNKELDETQLPGLIDLAKRLSLTNKQVVDLQWQILGEDLEMILAHQRARTQYREAIQEAWAERILEATVLEQLTSLAHSLDLLEDQIKEIECEVMGGTKEIIFERQQAVAQYSGAVNDAWADRTIDAIKIEQLTSLAHSLDLPEDQIKEIECEVMGGTKEEIFAHHQALAQYREAVNDAWADQRLDRRKMTMLYAVANSLNLSDVEIDNIEFELMNDIKERIFISQYKVSDRIRKRVDHFVLMKTLTGAPYEIRSIVFSPDGQTLASSTSGYSAISGLSKETQFWNPTSGELLDKVPSILDNLVIAFNPDGMPFTAGCSPDLLVGTRSRAIEVYHARTKALLYRITEPFSKCSSLSSDGQVLAAGYEDRTVRVWSLQNGEMLHTLQGHSGKVYALTISSDGQTLASVGDGQTVNLWKLSTGERLGTFAWQNGYINVVAVGREGQQLACGESTQSYESPDIKVWDTVTGQELFNLKGHSRSIHSLAFSPDGKILASGSRDKSVKLWDMRTGKLLESLTGHTSDVNAVAFSPYGHVLATGSKDKTIKLWKVNSGLTTAKTGG